MGGNLGYLGLVFLWFGVASLPADPFRVPHSALHISRMRPMLGTYVEITVTDFDRERADSAIEKGFVVVEEVDRLLSSHHADSELNAINAAAGDRAIAVSPWTYECISAGVEIGRQSDGAFDITCRPILDLWGFVRKQYRFPTASELQSLLPLVNYKNVILLINNITIKGRNSPREGQYRVGLVHPGMKLDVGGIGKGFAVDKAVEALQRTGVQSGLVRAGGDLRGFGPRPWRVGIANPSRPPQAVVEFEIQNEAVSTAGDYENFFEIHGRHYSHMIDPRTGRPACHRHSLSVRAPTCALSDAWSTALFVNPKIRVPDSIQVIDTR